MSHNFAIQTDVTVRFSDTDAMGHVNNARYFSYLEEGRVAYFAHLFPEVKGDDYQRMFPFILADIQCSFKAPVFYGEILTVSLGVTEFGGKSFVMEYEVTDRDSQRLVATARSVQVMYDYDQEKAYPIPDTIKERIIKLEGRKIKIR